MGKSFLRVSLTLLAASVLWAGAAPAPAEGARPRLGTVTGLVRDNKGQPLAGAIIRFMREGADHVVKQTTTSGAGTFTARVLPGKYLLTAAADGFNSVSFNSVQVAPSAEISYRFNLEPLGQGRTEPERRADRNDPKWRLRSAQSRRSVFQMDAGADSAVEAAEAARAGEETTDETNARDAEESADAGGGEGQVFSRGGRRPVHGVVETYAGFSQNQLAPSFMGANFALTTRATDDLDLVLAGQFATNGLGRLETTARFRLGDDHRVSATVGGATLPAAAGSGEGTRPETLGQFSVRAVDEWIVRDGVVVVLGLDYSRLVGRDGLSSLSPRLGFQFDVDPRTRFQAAYAPGGAGRREQSSVSFEGGPVLFAGPGESPVAFVDGRAVLERSHRLEFGVERVLDNDSAVEASAFFDTVDGRGVGLMSLPVDSLGGEGGEGIMQVTSQQGAARGLRVVYTRRVGRHLKTSAGYAFGRGQELSPEAFSAAPGDIFRSGFFQTAAAQLDSSFNTGTRVRTVLRFSPRAAIFAIDPFEGRVAVFDPSLSILVTQELPTFGLPVRAEAILDARNLLDTQACVEDGETVTTVNAGRRTVRGGISVRF